MPKREKIVYLPPVVRVTAPPVVGSHEWRVDVTPTFALICHRRTEKVTLPVLTADSRVDCTQRLDVGVIVPDWCWAIRVAAWVGGQWWPMQHAVGPGLVVLASRHDPGKGWYGIGSQLITFGDR